MDFSEALRVLAAPGSSASEVNEARNVVAQVIQRVEPSHFKRLSEGLSVTPDPSSGEGEDVRIAAVAAAERLYERDGGIEVDAEAAISVGSLEECGGCFVAGWLWVPVSEMALGEAVKR